MCVTQFDTVRNYLSRCKSPHGRKSSAWQPKCKSKPIFKQSTEKPVNQRNTQCNTQLPQTHSELSTFIFVSSNVNSSHKGAMLYIFEDDEAVIKMTIKGRSLTQRHVSRTHRVAIDRLFDIFFGPRDSDHVCGFQGSNSQTCWPEDFSLNATVFCVYSI